MFTLIRRSSNYVIKRHLHDRKLPSVKLPKNKYRIDRDTKSKADIQINKEIHNLNKSKKLKYEDF